MELFYSIDLLIFTQFILLYIIVSIYKQRLNADFSLKLFLLIVCFLSVVNILEGVTWALSWPIPSPNFKAVYATNSLLLLFTPLPAASWVLYADYKIFNDPARLKRVLKWYLIPFYFAVVLLIINAYTGIVFYIDENNLYHRNIGVYLIALATYGMVFILYIRTRKYKKQIDGTILQSIFLLMLIPLAAGIIQIFLYGVLIIWPTFILATLMAFIKLEKDAVLRDPLTSLPCREQLERRLQYLINRKIGFSVLMTDMDNFKTINDQYGHFEGDHALIVMASILKHNVNTCDMVCRYGGDEFVILIESEKNHAAVLVKKRIKEALERYNRKKIKPYCLSISFGHAAADPSIMESAQDILEEADRMMYLQKDERKR